MHRLSQVPANRWQRPTRASTAVQGIERSWRQRVSWLSHRTPRRAPVRDRADGTDLTNVTTTDKVNEFYSDWNTAWVNDVDGGLHAAGLYTREGRQVAIREDVGRHNAVDKLIGRRFMDGETSLADYAMVVSGRASFEILQKALVAAVPMIVAIGAPSSLAVNLADKFGMTLIGFASAERFNVYSGPGRIVSA